MKGWKTVIANVMSVLATLLALRGVDFTPEQQAEVASGAVALIGLVNVVMRHFTESKAAWREPGAGRNAPVILVALLMSPMLTACGSSGTALLEAVSLEPCEIGHVDVRGNFDISQNPLVTANVFVEMREEHTAESIPRDCPGFGGAAADPPPGS